MEIEHNLSPEFQEKLDKVKKVIKENWKPFAVGAVFTGTLLVMRGRLSVPVRPSIVISPVFNNDNSSLVNFGGHTTKIVKRLSDGKVWESVTEAAAEAGCHLPKMSRHLNGHNPHVYNEVYKIVGVGTTG